MSIAVGDKLKGTLQLTLPDETFFTAECQMNVIATGKTETAAEAKAAEAARAAEAAKAAKAPGATGATGHQGATHATASR